MILEWEKGQYVKQERDNALYSSVLNVEICYAADYASQALLEKEFVSKDERMEFTYCLEPQIQTTQQACGNK